MSILLSTRHFGRRCSSLLQQTNNLRLFSTKTDFVFVSLKSISADDLGFSILHRKRHTGEKSATDVLEFGVKCAKLCSLGSSTAGLIMVPVLSKSLGAAGAAEKPGLMAFLVVSNAFLALLTFTPLLLHALTKRFVADVYYNPGTQTFTTIHYNFLLQKRALRFKAQDVQTPEKSPAMNKLWIPLATCFVGDHPLLLLLDPVQYSNLDLYRQLTANIPPPPAE